MGKNSFAQTNANSVSQYADQIGDIEQRSNEAIFVLNSKEVTVESTDTQVAVSLQVALQVAIAIVVQISIADDARAEKVTEELMGYARIDQSNRQLIVIDGCEGVNVSTVDTDVAASIQVLLQILVALVGQLDIL
ncbi:spore coat protein [Aquibacillus koreensis]|uniref:Spore coat protein n=1 Tax=Aquibacillus koreensis TaxID=279446 RepID=A0A9X4AIU2_9BACI|nr:spore coat protein [Aquibacillus koreensis]MCT2535230.1 spore coat protein [Aquibacillus koreensis]MDC3421089.1 spore coat protein [Aquibacillus koreensis]